MSLFHVLFGLFLSKRRRPIGFYRRADDATIASALTAYHAWAARHHLAPTDRRRHVFAGMIAGRQIVFTTGLAGSSPLSPELLVTIEVPVSRPLLAKRGSADPIAAPILRSNDAVRSVGLTQSSVRVTFEKLADPDALDAALGVLDEAVRNLRSVDLPYRD